jgi:hypothetical protein
VPIYQVLEKVNGDPVKLDLTRQPRHWHRLARRLDHGEVVSLLS